MKITHDIKILPEYYNAIINNTKTFEVRYNDRNYQIGDILNLQEFHNGKYTGRSVKKEVCYMIDDELYCKKDFVIMGIK